jgi:hypothetical protein
LSYVKPVFVMRFFVLTVRLRVGEEHCVELTVSRLP